MTPNPELREAINWHYETKDWVKEARREMVKAQERYRRATVAERNARREVESFLTQS